MSNAIDWLLHFAGGVAIGAACLYLPPAVLAILMPTLLGWVRESEQARHKPSVYRPSNVLAWSPHRVSEWLSWTAGALLALGVYALA